MEQDPKKITIHAYEKKTMTSVVASFTIPVTPEQYSESFKNVHDKKVPKGAQGTEPKFKLAEPTELKLDFVLDGTKTIYGYPEKYKNKSVVDQIEDFKGVAYKLKDSIHRPRYLKLITTDLTFYCVLKEFQVTYTLFDSLGSPLRAKLSTTFLNFKETERRVREEGKSSPDLTHVRTVLDYQTLPIMVNDIYGSSELYLEVARVNKLTNFRRLPAGQEIFFPPEKKGSV